MQLNVGMWFLYFKLLGTTSRHDKLSNKPKMGSIATILSNLRSLEKCPKNYLPQKKPIFDHFLVQIDNSKLFLVSVGTYIWYRWKAHRIWRRSVKQLGTYHLYGSCKTFFRIVHHKCNPPLRPRHIYNTNLYVFYHIEGFRDH